MNDPQDAPREEIRDVRLQEPTFIDPLTRLFNQYYLYHFFPEEIRKAKLGNYPLVIFMIDLDNFKDINDNYGHLYGDEVLKQFAQILKKSVRQTDMVIRYAGDEFVILLFGMDIKRAEMLANQLVQNVDKNVFKGRNNEDLHLTVSIGFAVYPNDAEEIDKLMDMADKALYLSKRKGRNKISQAKDVTTEEISYVVAMDSFPCPRFIDRQEEMDILKQTFDTVVIKSNLLQVVFISGASGVGKSRLLKESASYISERALLINCNASPSHAQDPYYLFAKGISAYIEKTGVDSPQIYSLYTKIPSAELIELSRIIPPLASVVGRAGDLEADDKKARFLLYKGLLDFLIELSKNQPLLVSFDDIQWADKATLELMRYLCKQDKNKRIFIISSFSDDKSGQGEDYTNLNELLEDIRFNDNVSQIKLANFNLEDTSLMLEAIFPGLGAGDKQFCTFIYETTKGNPSFIEELLKSLVEDAAIFYQDKRWQIKKDIPSQNIPLSPQDVMKKRLKNLDEETKEMILQAAVIGEDFSVDLLKKIDNRNESFMLELLKRAKKLRLINELQTMQNFSFINKNLQNTLYNELSDEQRNQLHYKVGQALAQEKKENIYDSAGELAYHFTNAPLREKAREYSRMFLEKTNRLFSPAETLEYLDKLAEDIVEEKEEERVAAELSDKMLKEAMGCIRSLQSAVKNFHLYPPGAMRTNAIKEVLGVLNVIFAETGRINFGEVEKDLVINNQRIPPREKEQANVDYFLMLMMEHNLKTISFMHGLLQEELDKFIQYLSLPAEDIREKGGWAKIIRQEGIKGIKIDEVRFVQVGGFSAKGEFTEKKKVQDVMLMEFLVGKLDHSSVDRNAVIQNIGSDPKGFAQTLMDAAAEVVKSGKDSDEVNAVTHSIEKINSQILSQQPDAANYAKDLTKVLLELKPMIRNKVIRSQLTGKDGLLNKEALQDVIETIPDEIFVDLIIEDSKEKQEGSLVIKNFIDSNITDESRKKRILSKLETELGKTDMGKEEMDFITGKIKWEDLPLDKRIDNLLRLPNEHFKGELGKIKAILEELASTQKKAELENLIYHLLVKCGQLEPQVSKDLKTILTNFIKVPFLSEVIDYFQTETRLSGLLKRLDIELDSKVFTNLLSIFKEFTKELTLKFLPSVNATLEIDKPSVKRYCQFIYQLINRLAKRFKWEESRNPQIYKPISDFLKEASYGQFLEILAYSIIMNPSGCPPEFRNILPIIGDNFVDTIIKLETQKIIEWGDSFRGYIMRKGIADLLRSLGEPALEVLGQRLSQMKEDISPFLIELIGHLKKEEWTDLLLGWLQHKDPMVRRAAIMALADIGTERAVEAISRVAEDERNKRIRLLAIEQIKKIRNKE